MSRHQGTKAFTLVEVIVVVAVLAVLMSMIVPRLVGHERRVHQLAAGQVADLLMMFAQREALSNRPVGIWHDKPRNTILLMILDIDPADPDAPVAWQKDRAVAPVKLPHSIEPNRGVVATADGRRMDFSQWPIATEPGKPRQRIEISLAAEDGTVKTIVLPGHSISPYQADDARALSALREPIDLDAAGRHREDW